MSELGIINIDFYAFSLYDPKVLLVSDNSTWLHIEDKPAIIEITIPGSSRLITFNYLKNGINSFNSHNLRITCLRADCTEEPYVELPDGIYTITVKASPDTFFKTKYHLKTDRTQQRIDKLLIDLGFEFNKNKTKTRDAILEIQMLRMIAEAYIRKEDVVNAKLYFDTAYSQLGALETQLEDLDNECNFTTT